MKVNWQISKKLQMKPCSLSFATISSPFQALNLTTTLDTKLGSRWKMLLYV